MRWTKTNQVSAGVALAAVLSIGLPFTEKWEGLRTNPYRDIIGKWTVCIGETNVPMREYSVSECREMFEDHWLKYYQATLKCYPTLAEAPASVQAMATDLAYNNGVAAVCNAKTTGRYLREKDWKAFCGVLPTWVKAGGKKSQGLVNRRVDSKTVCLSGLPT